MYDTKHFIVGKRSTMLLSYRLREGLEYSRLRLEPDASLYLADSVSFRLTRRAHSSSTLLSIGPVSCLILSSTNLRVSWSVDVSSLVGSLSVSFRSRSSMVSEELSSVCLPVLVSSLVNREKSRRYINKECWL